MVGTVANVAGAGHWASNASTLVNNISSPMLRSAVVAPIASAAGHVAGGTTWNMIEEQSFGDAFGNSFDGIGKSMVVGTTTALATTYTQGYSPWNGEKLSVKGTPKPSPKFKQPTNPPQAPPTSVPEGYNLRIMPPTEQYPNDYWVIEKTMPQGGYQKINPATMRPGQRHETHVPLPPGY